MGLNFSDNITGNQVAALAWEIPENLLKKLLVDNNDPQTIDDTRSQLALWGISQKKIVFANFAEAWNSFVAPKAGITHPIVLLPGSACTRCLKARFASEGLGRGGEKNCPECKGTGRRRPRAIRASYAKAPQHSPTTTTSNLHKNTPVE